MVFTDRRRFLEKGITTSRIGAVIQSKTLYGVTSLCHLKKRPGGSRIALPVTRTLPILWRTLHISASFQSCMPKSLFRSHGTAVYFRSLMVQHRADSSLESVFLFCFLFLGSLISRMKNFQLSALVGPLLNQPHLL